MRFTKFLIAALILLLSSCATIPQKQPAGIEGTPDKTTSRVTSNLEDVRDCKYLREIDWEGDLPSLRRRGIEMGANVILVTEEANQIAFVNGVKSFRLVAGETGMHLFRGKAYFCE